MLPAHHHPHTGAAAKPLKPPFKKCGSTEQNLAVKYPTYVAPRKAFGLPVYHSVSEQHTTGCGHIAVYAIV
jgi:hypothetical protein